MRVHGIRRAYRARYNADVQAAAARPSFFQRPPAA
eukprot:COSAG02_NODE_5361_length_4398_cov_2.302163_8_plen_34_part_01